VILVARRWTSDLDVLKAGRIVRRIVSEGPALMPDVNDAGDVLVGRMDAGRFVVVLNRAADGRSEVVAPGPLDGTGSFASGGAVVFMSRDAVQQRDTVVLRNSDGTRRQLLAAPSADYPVLSPAGDRLAYVAFTSYPHVALVDVPVRGPGRMFATSVYCRPRWLGRRLWIAQGPGGSFDWVEIDGDTGELTGRRVPGSGDCGWSGANTPLTRVWDVRIVHREPSRLVAWPRREYR
jgi:hypothetical protein